MKEGQIYIWTKEVYTYAQFEVVLVLGFAMAVVSEVEVGEGKLPCL